MVNSQDISEKKKRLKYLILENVDRLLISPSSQRGRDFAVILKSLDELGYTVEWRLINAADYGMPQRRRRIFILAYSKDASIYEQVKKCDPQEWMIKKGTLANAFPVQAKGSLLPRQFELKDNIAKTLSCFNLENGATLFENSGVMIKGRVTTLKTRPQFSGHLINLKDILQKEVRTDLYLAEKDIPKWHYLKGAKKKVRIKADGSEYEFREGSMPFPDVLDRPSRTIITSEGGPSPSRCTHVIGTTKGLRRLSPIELERLNMFPDDHTKMDGIPSVRRGFFMGNALVVGVIEKIVVSLYKKIR